jgi:hypothetical protein
MSGAAIRAKAFRRVPVWADDLLTAAVVFALYAGALGAGLVWDDLLTAAPPTGLRAALSPHHGQYYRPLVMLSFALDRALWGANAPIGMHLTNVASHALVAIVLRHLSHALGFSRATALAAALVFAAHPVQSEAVTYVSGRTDILAALFVLLAILTWRRARRTVDLFALATALLTLAALCCKEAAIGLPLVLASRTVDPGPGHPRPLLPLGCAAAWLVGWTRLGGLGLRIDGLGDRLPAIGVAAADYLGLLVFPGDLHLERFTAVTEWNARAIGSWTAVVGVAIALLMEARRVRGGRLYLLLALVTYLPVSGVLPVYPQIADRWLFTPEHFLYLPLLGIAPVVVAAGAMRCPTRLRPAACAAVLLLWGATVVDRNRDWIDEETLFIHTLRYAPPVGRVWFNLGNIQLGRGNLDAAATLFEAALIRSPTDPAIHLNLGIARHRLGDLAAAESHYREALSHAPTRPKALHGLAAVLASRGDVDGARALLEGRARARERAE